MPLPGVGESDVTCSSSIVITVKYGGVKATQFFSKYTRASYQQLISDLKKLGFPHPKRSNIVLISHGVVEFFWSIEHNESSFFVNNLKKRVNMFQERQLSGQQDLSITSMSIREDADYESSLESHTSTSALPKPLQNKLQNKDLSLSMPSAKTLGERFHPYNRFSRRPAFAQQGNGTINQAPQSKPVKATDSGQRGAERFLSNMEQSLGLSKQEPIEPAIPPPVTTTPLAPAASLMQRKNSSPELSIKREQISPSLAFSTPHSVHVGPPHIDLTHESAESANSSNSSRVSYSTTSDKISVAADQIAASPRIPDLQHFSHPSSPLQTSRAEDLLSIQNLNRELLNLRAGISAALNRQDVVVEELKNLGVKSISFEHSLVEAKTGTAMKVRWDELEKELEASRAKEIELRKELQVEKLRRSEMKSVLEDIQREQKSPFVVPALLETFIQISQASTAATLHKISLAPNQSCD